MTRIKANVAKMASQNAPEQDIDGYIASEGTSVEAVKAFNSPQYQGGAKSPANVAAQEDVKKAQRNVELLDPAVGAVGSAYNATWPVSLLAKKAIGQGNTPVPEATTSGGKLLQDTGMLANPLLGEAIGLGIKGLSNTGKALSDVFKYSKPGAQIKLAEEVQNSFLNSKRAVIDKYGKEYADTVGKSDKKIDLNSPIKNFVDEAQSITQNPELVQQMAAKNPQAMRIFDLVGKITKQEVPEEISVQEANKLQQYIKNLPSIKSKLAQGSKNGFHTVQWTNEDRMLVGLADDIKSSIIEAHPELVNMNKEYGSFMNSYKKIAPEFKIGSTIDKLKNYHTLDPQKKSMLEGIVPKDTVNKIKDFNRADITSQVLKKLGLGVAGAAGMGAVGKEAWELTGH